MQVVVVSCKPGETQPLLETLLKEGLVACGNIFSNISSHYYWKGELCSEVEEFLWMETCYPDRAALIQKIISLHSYEVPKILFFEVTESAPDYHKWVRERTSK